MIKVFVSYKYGDSHVFQDPWIKRRSLIWDNYERVTPRHYLNAFDQILAGIAIKKWEPDGEDLSQFTDETIASNLRDMIYDSSVTIVLISPGMRDAYKAEKYQWIPWEISYSLREATRNGRTSRANALLVVVLPDENNDYSYCIEKNPYGGSLLKFGDSFCFSIIAKNFFNRKNLGPQIWNSIFHAKQPANADDSYIVCATWNDFKNDPKYYLGQALMHREHINDYNLCKTV